MFWNSVRRYLVTQYRASGLLSMVLACCLAGMQAGVLWTRVDVVGWMEEVLL